MNHTVLEILGKAQTAAVKRDAEIGVAQVLILDLTIKHLKSLYFDLLRYITP